MTYTAESDDEDIAQVIAGTLEANLKEIYRQFKFPKRIIFKAAERKRFQAATECHICEKELGEDKVRDHCHLTGLFRRASHNMCNLQYRISKFFTLVFHNLTGYDAHLFIKKLGGTENKINVIPCNEEKYISFSKEILLDKFVNKEIKKVDVKRELRFIGSFRFMPSNLGALANNLRGDQCRNLKNRYSGIQFKLLRKKGCIHTNM